MSSLYAHFFFCRPRRIIRQWARLCDPKTVVIIVIVLSHVALHLWLSRIDYAKLSKEKFRRNFIIARCRVRNSYVSENRRMGKLHISVLDILLTYKYDRDVCFLPPLNTHSRSFVLATYEYVFSDSHHVVYHSSQVNLRSRPEYANHPKKEFLFCGWRLRIRSFFVEDDFDFSRCFFLEICTSFFHVCQYFITFTMLHDRRYSLLCSLSLFYTLNLFGSLIYLELCDCWNNISYL